jgi:hypothetical protein
VDFCGDHSRDACWSPGRRASIALVTWNGGSAFAIEEDISCPDFTRVISRFLVDNMLAMPDEDPPDAWEEAMRDLDAHRPHRKLFGGLY